MHLLFLLWLGAEASSTSAFQHARPAHRIGDLKLLRFNNNNNGRHRRRSSVLLRDSYQNDPETSESSLLDRPPPGTADDQGASTIFNRRIFMGSVLVAAGTLAGGTNYAQAAAQEEFDSNYSLPWKVDPVNKRSGVTVFDAERAGYNVAFVTYLSRFLLNYDANCQRWWFSTKMPKNASPDDIEKLRVKQFAAFSASVEVGLQEYATSDGPQQLAEDLALRYGKVPGSINVMKADDDPNQKRYARSARRQIALLFGLLEKNQPVKQITKLLASVDNGGITSVQLMSEANLSGFEVDKPPQIVIPPPEAGESYIPAEVRAYLKPTGKLLRVDITDAGSGYSEPPVITISTSRSDDTPAKVQAKIATTGANEGSIESIELNEAGSGYTDVKKIKIQVSRPELETGRAAVLSPVLDMAIDRIDISQKGTGYAVEKPLKVLVEIPSKQSEFERVGIAYATAEKTSFMDYRRESDNEQIQELENQFEAKYNMKPTQSQGVSGIDGELPPLPIWSSSGKSSSAELLRLLPAGIGLEYDSASKRYALAADTAFLRKYPALVQQSSNRPLGSDYGPRGRAPIERDMQLGLASYLRFGLSGGICVGGVHLALTPLDVVKTKSQVDPIKYPNIQSSLALILAEEGPSTLFTGWLPTLLGNFIAGGTLYGVTEFLRRSLTEGAGVDAVSLEIPIILVAAAIASSLNACLICPFEAVRIRTVAQPEYGANSIDVLTRMVNEEGVDSLVNAIPVFLAKNIPYAMVKFLVFDLSSEKLYELFPAAQEELKLSLLVSLVAGVLGGVAAAIISNPADTVISELKKAKSDISPIEAANNMIERAGPQAFFVGLPLRMVFYSLNVSMTFVVYDFVKFLMGIGSQDLKLYLDVLGGALGDGALV